MVYTIRVQHGRGSISHRATSAEDAIEHLDRLWTTPATVTDNATGFSVSRTDLEEASFYSPPLVKRPPLN